MGRNAQRRRAARAAQPQPVQSLPVLFYDVELWHLDDEPELSWSAEGAISGDSFKDLSCFADAVGSVGAAGPSFGTLAFGATWSGF